MKEAVDFCVRPETGNTMVAPRAITRGR